MVTNGIIEALEQEIKQQKEILIRLEQAAALLRGGSPVAVSATKETPAAKPRPVAAAKPARGQSPATKLRKKWKSGKPLPWVPANRATPATRAMYDLLADGTSFTTAEIFARLSPQHPTLTESKVQTSLVHMRHTGRLMFDRLTRKWRRKYSRQQNNEILNLQPETLPANQQSEAVAKLEALVASGQLVKVPRGDRFVYQPARLPVAKSTAS